jgi:membrane-bound ClpP family serine protease
MSLGGIAILLVIVAVVLLVAELLLPSHGILGVGAGLSYAAAVGICFFINKWLGLSVFLGSVLASPFVYSALLEAWMRSPVGKRVVLQPQEAPQPVPLVRVGQVGIACSDLRPTGECDFGDIRVEAISEHGIIRTGESVKVVAMNGTQPMVRPAKQLTNA